MFVALAGAYGWTPEQVLDMDPEFVDELMMYREAEAEHQKEQQRLAEQKAKAKRRR